MELLAQSLACSWHSGHVNSHARSSSPSCPGPERRAADLLTGNLPPAPTEPPTLAFWTQMATPPVMRVPQATAGVIVRGEAGAGRVGSVQEGLPLESG